MAEKTFHLTPETQRPWQERLITLGALATAWTITDLSIGRIFGTESPLPVTSTTLKAFSYFGTSH